ncbi:MAG: hypothetical protein IPO92_07745 [Saprospiraceae bacterium]|nr:hypothetical protein [Saprospiraceae bacterium]
MKILIIKIGSVIIFSVTLIFLYGFIRKVDHISDFKDDYTLIKGITVVAPPSPIGAPAFKRLRDINTEWVAFVPYGFTKKGTTDLKYNLDWQWWGEKKDGIEACIKAAKAQGLSVMLKPQVYIGGGWVGDLNFNSEEDWKSWEARYGIFIMDYLKLASKYDVDMFCIGTEFNISVVKRDRFWKELIKEIRKTYKGKITYSANWDKYQDVKFWSEMDFIGISSYFPLSEAVNPTITLLNKEWKPIIKKLKSFSESNKRKIIFTEYGYMSVDGCAGKSWEIEKNLKNLNINQQAQSNAYDALWSNLIQEDFWAGGFIWKWFPDGMGHEGYPDKDYTPQDKPAEKIIRKWFNTNKKI